MVQVNLGNKTFYLLLAFVVVAICAAVAYAVSPSVFGHTSSEITVSCPSGFTLITNKGQNLGCMQNNAQPAKAFLSAMQDCWENYGAKLPSYAEAYTAFKYNFVTLPTGPEQLDFAISSGYCSIMIDPVSFNIYNDYSRCSPFAYRCFIPA